VDTIRITHPKNITPATLLYEEQMNAIGYMASYEDDLLIIAASGNREAS